MQPFKAAIVMAVIWNLVDGIAYVDPKLMSHAEQGGRVVL